jgi:hypothetical protein
MIPIEKWDALFLALIKSDLLDGVVSIDEMAENVMLEICVKNQEKFEQILR